MAAPGYGEARTANALASLPGAPPGFAQVLREDAQLPHLLRTAAAAARAFVRRLRPPWRSPLGEVLAPGALMSGFPEVAPDVVARYEVPGPRYTSYPPVTHWSSSFGPDDYRARLAAAAREGAASPLSLYLHLPFCHKMCGFCGCNVVIAKDQGRADPYVDDVIAEIELVAGLLDKRRHFAQLHFGGGTPTFLREDQLQRLWDGLRRCFSPTGDAELAVEVNPVVTSAEQLGLLRRLGFNRLSIGVQDLDPAVQEAIGRVQSVAAVRDVVVEARRLGFSGINFDLIYGLPLQTPASWRRTLDQVLQLAPDRLAVYSFAYVPDLKPHQRRLGAFGLPHGTDKLSLFKLAYDRLTAAGYLAIGMDHFARAGDELAQAQAQRRLWRSFQGYTIKRSSDTVAFGSSGISDVQGAYAQNGASIPRYHEAIQHGRLATARGFVRSADDQRRSDVITRIMCNFWVDLGEGGATYFARELEALRALEREGLVRVRGTEIELSPLGRAFVRNVAMIFDAHLDTAGPARAAASTV